MKKIAIGMLLIICFPAIAWGAQIYGTLKWNNGSVNEGVPVLIRCDEGEWKGQTDAYGSYSVGLRPSKNCGLFVYFANQWSTRFPVYPYEDPVRYDFDIVRQGDGRIALQRR